jgi:hypothetical protein
MIQTLAIMALHLTPGGLFMLFALSMREAYFFPAYLLTGLVFLLVSLGFALRSTRRTERFQEKPAATLFVGLSASWFMAWLFMGLLNLTPLCIGQDNGDGINGLSECMQITVLAGGVYTAGMLGIVALTAACGCIIFRIIPADRRG